jgi:hypothetical protein
MEFLPLSEAEIHGLRRPAQANLAWFQSVQLPSTQPASPLALIPLAPDSACLLKYVLNRELFFFIFRISNRITRHSD